MATWMSPEADQHHVPDEVPDICGKCGQSAKGHNSESCVRIQLMMAGVCLPEAA
jgi:hypothetical protein